MELESGGVTKCRPSALRSAGGTKRGKTCTEERASKRRKHHPSAGSGSSGPAGSAGIGGVVKPEPVVRSRSSAAPRGDGAASAKTLATAAASLSSSSGVPPQLSSSGVPPQPPAPPAQLPERNINDVALMSVPSMLSKSCCRKIVKARRTRGRPFVSLAEAVDECLGGGCVISTTVYRYIACESLSQFDSPPDICCSFLPRRPTSPSEGTKDLKENAKW